jgi:cell division protein FtsZ
MDFDYSDVKTVLPSKCPVTFGVGEASGSERALEAFKKALHPLSRGGVEIDQATGVLVNITGSSDMNMDEYNVINNYIHSKVHEDTNVKIGVVRDDDLAANIKVTVYLSKQ